ncbi:RBR-type E3 ubiquitin transferase [Melia azedarach]|uniref:RBR-type E3 ubiquitin transferase n=1 Tax=Melia azedarach TaxID=155640 RepID=A0ACC1YKA4_MELAZ|nr:RBR-type E3 ubiquitin transferase [Melia azedarach]
MGNSVQKPTETLENPLKKTLANRQPQAEETLENPLKKTLANRQPQAEETLENPQEKTLTNSQPQAEETKIPRKKEEENASSFTCEICIEPIAAINKFKNKNLCTHPFCQDCIAKYIEAEIQYNNTARIQCPGLDCQQILDPISCKPLIPENLFTRWCDLLRENCVLGFERSYCPNRNSGALVEKDCERNGKVKKARCPNCEQWFCFQCKLRSHAGYRCDKSSNILDPDVIRFLRVHITRARCASCGHSVRLFDGHLIICRLVC